MKDMFAIFMVCLPAAICTSAAFYLAVQGMNGWGWFLFVGLILGGGISVKTNNAKVGADSNE